MILEKFKCLNPLCGYTFERKSGPTTCIKCNSIYVDWTNFNDDWECNEASEFKWRRKMITIDPVEKKEEPVADGKRSIYCTATPELFNRIFDTLIHDMCGDDDVALFCRHYDYKEVVKLFKEYEVLWADGVKKVKEVYDINEDPKNNRTTFHMGQDNVCIEQYNGENDIKQWTDMVIIK